MAQLDFDEGLGKQLEAMYRRRDVIRRRRLVMNALGAQPGEDVVDVGCGPGFYLTELAEQVGPQGSVTGIDRAPAMLAVAAKRAERHENVAFHRADATSLPVPDQTFDALLSVQVLEYVPDVDRAIAEIHRVLRPGGRAVIWDVDWATVSWQSGDDERMRAMLDAWDEHLVHKSIPRTLAPSLRTRGFHNVTAEGHAFTTIELDPETYGGSLIDVIAEYAAKQAGMDPDEVRTWRAEQEQSGANGEFYFSCVQCCFIAHKS
ncbi:MAG: arsenite methyltransferase [Mycobacterium sp.]|jgi:arsenite methyltransferase|nr:arsenite methyltransferase [Mycobacterium sp.]